jgi:hypothetical protein
MVPEHAVPPKLPVKLIDALQSGALQPPVVLELLGVTEELLCTEELSATEELLGVTTDELLGVTTEERPTLLES